MSVSVYDRMYDQAELATKNAERLLDMFQVDQAEAELRTLSNASQEFASISDTWDEKHTELSNRADEIRQQLRGGAS